MGDSDTRRKDSATRRKDSAARRRDSAARRRDSAARRRDSAARRTVCKILDRNAKSRRQHETGNMSAQVIFKGILRKIPNNSASNQC
jgi:hypothetical protein